MIIDFIFTPLGKGIFNLAVTLLCGCGMYFIGKSAATKQLIHRLNGITLKEHPFLLGKARAIIEAFLVTNDKEKLVQDIKELDKRIQAAFYNDMKNDTN